METWITKKIKDIASIGDGCHTSLKRTNNGIPYLTSKNFKIDGISLKNIEYISEDTFNKNFKEHSKALTKPMGGDVLLSIIGSLGAPYLVKKNDKFGLSSSVSIIRSNKINTSYLYYWIKSPLFQSAIHQIKSGVAQSFMSLGMIGELPVKFPDSQDQQKKIVKILSILDEKITCNTDKIKLLEEITKIVYEEWFLKFTVNNKKLEINKSTKLPFGWEWKPFESLINFKEGPGIRNWQYRKNGVPFLNIRVIKDGEIDKSEVQFLDPKEVNNKYKHFLLQENDHVISSSGTLGRISTIRKSHLPLCLNTSIIRVRKKRDEFGTWLIKHMLQGQLFQKIMESYAVGTAQLNFGPTHLQQIKIPCPPIKIAMEYEKIMEPIEEEIKILRDKNVYLKNMKNIILPRLMTGKIDINSLKI